MIDVMRLYSGQTNYDVEIALCKIVNLCQVGIAASDSLNSIDMSQGGHEALYEIIALVAYDGLERFEEQNKRSGKSGKDGG